MSITYFTNAKYKACALKVPLFGEEKYPPDPQSELFASNLTYTFDNFSNTQHEDNDESKFTMRMWFPVTAIGSNLSNHTQVMLTL